MSDPYQAMIATLSRCRRVLITTHTRPDGDALGTAAAMHLALKLKGIDSQVLLLTHLPRKYAFIFRNHNVPFVDVEKGWPATFPFDSFDAMLVVDTGTWSQLPGLREHIAGWKAPRLVIDHHLTQENWADHKLVVSDAAAAGEIAAELLEQWDIDLTGPIAEALFLAIATDTGWFSFSNTRPFTLRLAAMLIESGVDPDAMYQHIYQNETAQRVALQTRAMQSLELVADQRLAVMTLRGRDFVETRAGVGDTENLINHPLQIGTVRVSILVTQPPEGGAIRVSLRSKGEVDVARFAERFGGGGHARASGLRLDGDIDAVRQRIVEAMVAALDTPAPP